MLEFKTIGFKKAAEIVKLMALPPRLKRRYLARVGRMVIAQAKKNVKEQRTVSGSPMEPRKKTQGKINKALAKGEVAKLTKFDRRLMLKGLVKGRVIGVRAQNHEAKVQFFKRAGFIGWKHQYGFTDKYEAYNYPGTFDTSKVQTRLNKKVSKDNCTANMAATLIRLQYLPKHLGQLPSGLAARLLYIMENVTRKQAMFLIKEGKKGLAKISLRYEIPARPFLGANDEQITRWGDEILNNLEGRFRAKDLRI